MSKEKSHVGIRCYNENRVSDIIVSDWGPCRNWGVWESIFEEVTCKWKDG